MLKRHRYAILLGLLLTAIAFQSFALGAGSRRLDLDVVRTALGLAIFFVVFERKIERVILGAVLVVLTAIAWSRDIAIGGPADARMFVFHLLLAVFMWSAVFVILREIFHRVGIRAENVLGAICGYLIAGDGWAAVNELAYQLAPSAFAINPQVVPQLADWHGRLALFSYYSLTNMLTLGYADVTPVRAPATTLSLFSTLFALFYTAVVVSQFVGLAQARRNEG